MCYCKINHCWRAGRAARATKPCRRTSSVSRSAPRFTTKMRNPGASVGKDWSSSPNITNDAWTLGTKNANSNVKTPFNPLCATSCCLDKCLSSDWPLSMPTYDWSFGSIFTFNKLSGRLLLHLLFVSCILPPFLLLSFVMGLCEIPSLLFIHSTYGYWLCIWLIFVAIPNHFYHSII